MVDWWFCSASLVGGQALAATAYRPLDACTDSSANRPVPVRIASRRSSSSGTERLRELPRRHRYHRLSRSRRLIRSTSSSLPAGNSPVSMRPVTRRSCAMNRPSHRRVYLDLIGRIPTFIELNQFLADSAANKHDGFINHLLTRRADYAGALDTVLGGCPGEPNGPGSRRHSDPRQLSRLDLPELRQEPALRRNGRRVAGPGHARKKIGRPRGRFRYPLHD